MISPSLDKLLKRLGSRAPRSWEAFATACWEVRYTGPATIHWRNGRIAQIDLGAPVRLSIVEVDPSLNNGGGIKLEPAADQPLDPGGLDKPPTIRTG